MRVSKRLIGTSLKQMTRSIALLVALALPLAADQLSDAFARLDKTAGGFKAMTADFKQLAYTAAVNDSSVESGKLKMKRSRPGDTRMLLEFTKPNAKFVALDGDTGQMYQPKMNVVQVADLKNKRDVVQQLLLLGFGATSAELKASYEISWVGEETIEGQTTGHIKLVPRSKELLQQIKQAELWLSNTTGTPVQQRIVTTASGDYTQLTYSNVQLNPSLNDKELKLTPPKGVQIQKVGQ